jgi:hypothetical protein
MADAPAPGTIDEGFRFNGGNPADPAAWTKLPDVGAVDEGYRFKGGDPAKQENWEKVGGVSDRLRQAGGDVLRHGPMAPAVGAIRQGADALGLGGEFKGVRDWLGTRGLNTLGGFADTGAMMSPVGPLKAAADMIGGVPAKVAGAYGGAPINYGADKAGVPQVNAAGRGWTTPFGGDLGSLLDKGTEFALGGAVMPGGAANILPSLLGGVGSDALGQATQGTRWEQLARLAGAVFGTMGGAGAQALTGRAVDAARALREPFSKGGQEAVAGRVYQRMATDPKAALAATENPQTLVPGSTPTTARVTNDPGLLATENVLANSGGRGGEFAVQAADNNAARARAIEAVQPTGAVSDARDFFGRQIADRRAALDTEVGRVGAAGQASERAALDALDRELAALPPGTSARDAGEIIQRSITQREAILRRLRGDAAEPFYTAAKESTVPVDAGPAVAVLNRQLPTSAGDIRAGIESALKLFERGGGEPRGSVAELMGTDKALAQAINAADRAGNRELSGVLNQARSQLSTSLQQEPLYGAGKQVFERMSRPLDPYRSGRVAPVLETDRFTGQPAMAPDVVPSRFFKPGADGGAAVRDFLAARPGPAATDALVNDITRQAREAFAAGNATRLSTFLQRHEPALTAIEQAQPGFMANLRRVASAAEGVDAARTSSTEAMTAASRLQAQGNTLLERSPGAKFTQADPQRAISDALGARDASSRFGRLVMEARSDGTGAALDGLRRGVVDDFKETVRSTATTAGGDRQMTAAAAVRWWDKNAGTIRQALDDPQYQAMKAIVDDFARDARSAPRVAGSDTMRNLQTGRLITGTILQEVLGPKLSGSPIAQSALRPIQFLYRVPEEQVRELLLDMAKDPATARALMMKANAGNLKLAAPALETHLVRSGAFAVSREDRK